MKEMGGMLFFVFLGILFIFVGLEGNLGSVLACVIDPSALKEHS